MSSLFPFLVLSTMAVALTSHYAPQYTYISLASAAAAVAGYSIWAVFLYTHFFSPLRHLPEPQVVRKEGMGYCWASLLIETRSQYHSPGTMPTTSASNPSVCHTVPGLTVSRTMA